MADSENSPDNYKTLEISFWGIIKNPEMIKFILGHLDTKTLCKHKVKKTCRL